MAQARPSKILPPPADPEQEQPAMALPGYQQVPQHPPVQDQATSATIGPAAEVGGGSVPGSSGASPGQARTDKPVSKLRAAPYEALARGLLRAAGGLLNSRLAVDEEDQSWLPDDEDDKNVPPPLGRLAARRVPFDPGAENLSELEDMAAAAVGLIAWAGKSLASMWEARRERRRAQAPLREAGTVIYDDRGDGDPAAANGSWPRG